MKTTTETTMGTPTTEPMAMMAPPVMTVLEMTAAATAVMTMVTSAQFLQSSVVDSQAPTGGSNTLMYQADKSVLWAIDFSFVMTPFFMNEISFFNLV
jgi:hypothetical protein